jgi:hypothetical protein
LHGHARTLTHPLRTHTNAHTDSNKQTHKPTHHHRRRPTLPRMHTHTHTHSPARTRTRPDPHAHMQTHTQTRPAHSLREVPKCLCMRACVRVCESLSACADIDHSCKKESALGCARACGPVITPTYTPQPQESAQYRLSTLRVPSEYPRVSLRLPSEYPSITLRVPSEYQLSTLREPLRVSLRLPLCAVAKCCSRSRGIAGYSSESVTESAP